MHDYKNSLTNSNVCIKSNLVSEISTQIRAWFALINITEEIRQGLDKDIFSGGVFLGFQKAFDTVNHNFLLVKRSHYGIQGITLEWFLLYLTDRRHRENYLTNEIITSNWAPQRLVLGSLLFLIYVNDLSDAIPQSIIHNFADDTNIIFFNKSLKN